MTLPEFLLGNAVTATGLAVVVFGITRFCRRPPIVYGLWLLVLLKLVSPPLVEVPVFARAAEKPAIVIRPPVDAGERFAASTLATPDLAPRDPGPGFVLSADSRSPGAPTIAAKAGVAAQTLADLPWRWILLAVWGVGAVAWFALTALRLNRFRRVIRDAPLAPNPIRRRMQDLAREFGVGPPVEVRVADAIIPPILWVLGTVRTVLIPDPLLRRLTSEQLDTLLAHELAHLCRRAHWVRLFELVVLGLYWWHPVVWWARRELQEAEEQCCDAWVLWRFPKRARAYARTLLETVEFLSETRPSLPPAASGFGKVNPLKRRFQMILHERCNPRLPSFFRWVMGAVGLLILPLAPLAARAEGDTFDKVIVIKSNGKTVEFAVDDDLGKRIEKLLKKSRKEPKKPDATSKSLALDEDFQKQLKRLKEALNDSFEELDLELSFGEGKGKGRIKVVGPEGKVYEYNLDRFLDLQNLGKTLRAWKGHGKGSTEEHEGGGGRTRYEYKYTFPGGGGKNIDDALAKALGSLDLDFSFDSDDFGFDAGDFDFDFDFDFDPGDFEFEFPDNFEFEFPDNFEFEFPKKFEFKGGLSFGGCDKSGENRGNSDSLHEALRKALEAVRESDSVDENVIEALRKALKKAAKPRKNAKRELDDLGERIRKAIEEALKSKGDPHVDARPERKIFY